MMKKILYLTTILIICIQTNAQNRKITKNGKITLEASTPFEEIKATNKSASCVFNTKTGEIASLALVKGFRFKVALMEEHFNENYIESSKYPKAVFKGFITNFNLDQLSKNNKEYEIKGELELHGKKQLIATKAMIKIEDNTIEIIANFDLTPSDFDIEIPQMVRKKIAEKVALTLDFSLN